MTHDSPTTIVPRGASASIMPPVVTERLGLIRADQEFHAVISFSCADLPILSEAKETFLHPDELATFADMKFEARQRSFLLGRYCAKRAVTSYADRSAPTEIVIRSGIFSQPIVHWPGYPNVQAAISHTGLWGSAIAFPEEHPMAIDLEVVDSDRIRTIQSQLTTEETSLIETLSAPKEDGYTFAWTAKEALSKVLKCGMMTPFEILALKEIVADANGFSGTFKNFFQYKVIAFRFRDVICSIIVPKKTNVQVEFQKLSNALITMAGETPG